MKTIKIKYASECELCACCDEPWCTDCRDHYADCNCLGPDSPQPGDDDYEEPSEEGML